MVSGKSKPETAIFEARRHGFRWSLKVTAEIEMFKGSDLLNVVLPHPTSAISVQYFLKNIWLSLPCWWWWWCCCCWWWWSKENSRGKQPSGMTVEKMPGRANLSRVLHCWGASTPSTYEFRSSLHVQQERNMKETTEADVGWLYVHTHLSSWFSPFVVVPPCNQLPSSKLT